MRPTRDMSAAHESFLVSLLGGRKMANSGASWRNPADVRTSQDDYYRFAADGKSTYAKSLSLSLEMIHKIREQAHGLRPMIPIRFYKSERLDVAADWIAVDAYDFSAVLEAANKWEAHLAAHPECAQEEA